MAQRKIIWTETASRQLRLILEFWVENNNSSKYSLKLLGQIESNLQGIAKFPLRCPESSFPETRVAAMKHYSILYKHDKKQVIVTAFWDNRQNPEKLIEILKNKDGA